MKYLLLFLSLIFFACVESGLDGDCDPPTLSKTKLYFNEHGGIDTVVIKKGYARLESWYEECELIKADHYILDGMEIVKVESDYCKNNYCSFQPRVTPDGMPYVIYDNSYNAPTVGIECPWYSVVHISEKSLLVSVKKNETGQEREVYVSLFAGDCGAGFRITQVD
jgi:hypothetical protein